MKVPNSLLSQGIGYDYNSDTYKILLKDKYCKSRLPYDVAVLNVTGDLTLGSVLRTSVVLGARRVISFGRKKFDSRSSVGICREFPVQHVYNEIEKKKKKKKTRNSFFFFFSIFNKKYSKS
eukprot:GHVR01022615.1.p1 GENE.GHVR01022615.1~~GHVR01022615.1.p1  ORF type:complete len:121 (+),score=15.52 GHVR01022615.1:61-423(+)